MARVRGGTIPDCGSEEEGRGDVEEVHRGEQEESRGKEQGLKAESPDEGEEDAEE